MWTLPRSLFWGILLPPSGRYFISFSVSEASSWEHQNFRLSNFFGPSYRRRQRFWTSKPSQSELMDSFPATSWFCPSSSFGTCAHPLSIFHLWSSSRCLQSNSVKYIPREATVYRSTSNHAASFSDVELSRDRCVSSVFNSDIGYALFYGSHKHVTSVASSTPVISSLWNFIRFPASFHFTGLICFPRHSFTSSFHSFCFNFFNGII